MQWRTASNMRFLTLILGLSLRPASGAEAQTVHWILVGTTDDTTYYIDSASVTGPRDGMVEVRTRQVHSRTIRGREGDHYDSRVVRYRVDCSKSMWRSIEIVYYRREMFVRRVLSTSRGRYHSPRWPQDQVLLRLACQRAAETRNSPSDEVQIM